MLDRYEGQMLKLPELYTELTQEQIHDKKPKGEKKIPQTQNKQKTKTKLDQLILQ